MNITLDGQANDGSPGEGDNVGSDFEHIDGTNSSDVFTGSDGHDQFSGGRRRRDPRRRRRRRPLRRRRRRPRLRRRRQRQGPGRQRRRHRRRRPGQDQIYGDIASCSVFCNSDPDQLFARDGERDTVDCGGGADQAQVDSLDIVAFCASVDRSPAPAGGGGPGGSAAAALALQAGKSIKLKALLKHGFAVRLKCAGACKVAATLSYKGKKLGSGRKTLHKAGNVRLAVRIGKKARRKVRRLRGKKLTLRVKVTSAGKTTTLTRKVKLKR